MMIPTVHINGTSRAELERQIETAHGWLVTTIEALEQAAPNGRDYYPQGDGALQVALREHGARLQKLVDVRDELQAIWQGLTEQPG